MASGIEPRLVTKGRRQTVVAVGQQARCSIELAHRHAVALATAGWSAADTAALEQALGTLDQLGMRKIVVRGEARRSTEIEGDAIEQAKRFLRRLRGALPRVLRGTSVTGVTAASFAAGGRLKRSQSRIAEYLLRISPAVAALDGELAAYFDGRSAAVALERIRHGMGATCTGQALAFGDLSVEVLGVHQAKGVVIEMLEDLRRLAANAFVEEPALAGQFRLHLLRRVGRARRRVEEAGEGERSGSGRVEVEQTLAVGLVGARAPGLSEAFFSAPSADPAGDDSPRGRAFRDPASEVPGGLLPCGPSAVVSGREARG